MTRDKYILAAVAAFVAWAATGKVLIAAIAAAAIVGIKNEKLKPLFDKIRHALEEAMQQSGTKPTVPPAATQPAPAPRPATGGKAGGHSTFQNSRDASNAANAAHAANTARAAAAAKSVRAVAIAVEHHRKEIPMFVKLIIAVVLSVASYFMTQSPGTAIGVFLGAFFIALIIEGVRIVPQQNAWVVERLGKFHTSLQPGFNLIVPFVDRVAYRHSLKEVPLDVPEQVCITKDNTQLAVDGIIYFQVVDPRLASYGTSDYELAISQLAQTALRSEVGKMELDKTFESRDEINHKVVSVLDEAGRTWGIKVLRYEIKSLTPPESILRSMQAQITAEREKRALIAKSEGVRQEEINIADGQRQAAILASEGEKQAAINKAQGEATALTTVAEATASAVRQVAAALSSEGGMQAANLKVAEKYVEQFGNIAKVGNTLIIPANLADAGAFVASAMTVLDKAKLGQGQK